MEKIKVLIVDDSALMREVLTRILSSDQGIEVVGTAPDPYIAVEKIKKLNPDVLTLDIEMPRMDGLTFLDKVMKSHPMPVVMISTWTSSNSDKAIKALALGAVDFVEKPSSNVQSKMSEIETDIINKVKNAVKCSIRTRQVALFDGTNNRTQTSSIISQDTKEKVDKISKIYKNKVNTKSNKLILIGASTGGTNAIEAILKELPNDMPGIVIVQHMPENFTKAFADRLNTIYDLDIKEAENGDTIVDGAVYIAPGGKQCYLRRNMGNNTIQITDDPPVNRHKPSVDALFYSAAENSCKNIISVILTGMGKDGAQGMLALKEAGSYNIAQDESSSIVYGMPKEAADIGAVHEILGLNKIAQRLVALLR